MPAVKRLPERPCDHCGTPYQPKRSNNLTCSRLCDRRARHARRYGEVKTRPCRHCSAPTPSRPGYPVCDTCRGSRDPAKVRAKEAARRLRTYGLTQEQYDDLFARQGGRCAICRTAQPGKKGWAIDHCHAAGGVRGILCQKCNTGLGLFGDDERNLRAAAAYVHEHRQLRLVV